MNEAFEDYDDFDLWLTSIIEGTRNMTDTSFKSPYLKTRLKTIIEIQNRYRFLKRSQSKKRLPE